MRMIKFTMYGYKRLLPGLGKDNITIEFKNTNIINIINGPNGIGKSTILNAMTPLPDTNDNFVDGKDAGKMFIYDNGYSIHIQNQVKNGTRQTSKAFISKNGIELNPTGNISSYKDLLFSEFGLDPCYIALTSLSNDDKGIAMKTPSVRKKFFNGLLSNMEVYNSINKTMVKRSNIFKSMINNITAKISSIGDESKLTSILSGIENELNNLEVNKNNLVKCIAEDEAKIKTLDPSAEIQTTYENVTESIKSLKSKKKSIDSILDTNQYYLSNSSKSYTDLEVTLRALKSSKERYEDQKKDISNEIDRLLNTQQEELQFHQTKIARLNGLKANIDFDVLEKDLSDIKDIMGEFNSILEKNKVQDFSSVELYSISDKYSIIKDQIDIIKSEDYFNEFIELFLNISPNQNLDILLYEKINSSNSKINELDLKISDISKAVSNSETILGLKKLIPNKCSSTKCELIRLIKDVERIQDCNNEFDLKIFEDDRKKEIENLEKYKEFIKLNKNIDSINNILKEVQNKVPHINIQMIDILNKDIVNNISNDFREFGNIKNRIEELSITYSKKSADFDIYRNKLDIIKEVEEDIKVLDSRLENISSDIEINNNKLVNLDIKINDLFKEIQDIESIINYIKDKEEINIEINSRLQQLSVLEHSMNDINIYLKNIENNNSKLSDIYNIIKSKTEDKERIKYSISMLKEYNTELSIYKEKYDMIETIKYYSSPTTGIQTLFMKLYMNNTLNICNDILGKMFGGELVLDEYVINENEFRIPCVNNNMYIDDISSMSSSQVSMISMIISVVLLKQSSSKFNIVRLDEIDAGLDTNNRIQFVNILIELIKILEIDQVIMVSHNMMELNSNNIDLIEIT